MTTYETILVERNPPLATITLNRPRQLNALNQQTFVDLHAAVDELGPDREVRAIILTGSGGRAFAAGADIGELQAFETAEDGMDRASHAHSLLDKLARLPQPVIVAVNGYALGGGCELALAGDIILASEKARFGQPEVNLGIIPGFGGSQRLPRLIGRTRALELLLTGEQITANEAFRLGFVNHVYPEDELISAAEQMGRTIAEKAPIAIALCKRAVYDGLEQTPADGNQTEIRLFGEAAETADRKEGTSAFLEKRKPAWQGR
jgi:enoyl-CoA hydratase